MFNVGDRVVDRLTLALMGTVVGMESATGPLRVQYDNLSSPVWVSQDEVYAVVLTAEVHQYRTPLDTV